MESQQQQSIPTIPPIPTAIPQFSSPPLQSDQQSTASTLPRLRFSRGGRKKPAPKLNMSIPVEEAPTVPLDIFGNKKLPSLPPMPKQFKNSQSKRNLNGSESSKNDKPTLNLVDSSINHNGVSIHPNNSNNSNNDNINGLPSAATTLTITSMSTLNDENSQLENSPCLISSFNNKLKFDESDEYLNNNNINFNMNNRIEIDNSYGNNNSKSNNDNKRNSFDGDHNYNDFDNDLSDSYNTKTPTENDLILTKSLDELTENDWKVLHERRLIETLEVLGEGNGGSVKKCRTLTKNPSIFALKIITTDPSPEFQKQMVRELNYNRKFNSTYIVKYYGTFLDESSSSIHICMEYMGGRSLDAIYKAFKERDGRLSEKPLGKIAGSVLKGLAYLNEKKVMHRDIKPQNILLDLNGNVKLCDFGVSGDVVNSLATTFTGTSFYMAPERIKNEPYTISCDVWSLGLTVLEGALGEFPFVRESSPDLMISPLDLLMIIIEFEPILEDEPEEGIKWTKGFKDFIKVCLTKEGRKRPSPRQMLEHPWLIKMMNKNVRMDKLVECCWGQN